MLHQILRLLQHPHQEPPRFNILNTVKRRRRRLGAQLLMNQFPMPAKRLTRLSKRQEPSKPTHLPRKGERRPRRCLEGALVQEFRRGLAVVDDDECHAQDAKGADGAAVVFVLEPVFVGWLAWGWEIHDVAEEGDGLGAWGERRTGLAGTGAEI